MSCVCWVLWVYHSVCIWCAYAVPFHVPSISLHPRSQAGSIAWASCINYLGASNTAPPQSYVMSINSSRIVSHQATCAPSKLFLGRRFFTHVNPTHRAGKTPIVVVIPINNIQQPLQPSDSWPDCATHTTSPNTMTLGTSPKVPYRSSFELLGDAADTVAAPSDPNQVRTAVVNNIPRPRDTLHVGLSVIQPQQ